MRSDLRYRRIAENNLLPLFGDPMTPDQYDFSQRLVGCKRWRWMPGMLAVRTAPLKYCSEGVDPWSVVGVSHRVLDVDDGDSGYVYCATNSFLKASTEYAPDLTDPATMGCLLALVREAWGNPRVVLVPIVEGMWGVVIPTPLRDGPRLKASTEVESLIAALEAAP